MIYGEMVSQDQQADGRLLTLDPAACPSDAADGPRQAAAAGESSRQADRILYVLTAPFGLEKTLGGQLRYLRNAGFEPWFACSAGEELEPFARREGVQGQAIPIEREIAVIADLRALWRLWRLMRRVKPRISNVSAPKAGLLGGLAAWLAGVPCRVYTLRGLRLETAQGAKYALLWAAEWLACRLAHRILCVGSRLAERVVELRLARAEQLVILGPGSSNGVDARRFEPGNPARIADLRRQWAIPGGAPVLGFVGRITHDKGIAELVAAYYLLRERRPRLRLLLVGCLEAGDPVPAVAREAIENDPGIVVTGFLDDPAEYYQLMDVVALPTYREGYPTVALEAAAAGRPFVTTTVTGAAEAVEHGETGLLVPPGDSPALAEAVAWLFDNPEAAATMAGRARHRVVQEFSQQRVWKAVEAFYRELLREQHGQAGRPVPTDKTDPTVPTDLNAPKIAAVVGGRGPDAGPPGERPVSSEWALSRRKRALDILVAGRGLVMAAPLLLLAAAGILMAMGRPLLFRQVRLGIAEQRFVIYKLRTMAEADVPGPCGEAQRLTRLGRLLRRWSLDELPQLANVLRGEMSLVGPRPLPLEYGERYSARQRRRHDVKPGITGWAQASGRNTLSWEQRFELDLWYAGHASLGLDLRILARSMGLVFSGAGVAPKDAALMPEFLGDPNNSI
ncbi:MAG: sugar transferase [Bryobacterales bacterium]